MPSVQQLAAKVATFAAVLAVGALSSNAAHAAIITGSVSGTWNDGQGANVNAGDAYTATYSYDDAALTPYDHSSPGYFQSYEYSGSLLSLIVNSGSYSHTFDFSNGSGSISFYNFIGGSVSPDFMYRHKTVSVSGYDYFAPVQNGFSASKTTGQYYDGSPRNYESAYLYSHNNQGYYTDYVGASNAKFTPDPTATAVPTPALLPGLIGLGMAALRKRKAEAAKQTSEV